MVCENVLRKHLFCWLQTYTHNNTLCWMIKNHFKNTMANIHYETGVLCIMVTLRWFRNLLLVLRSHSCACSRVWFCYSNCTKHEHLQCDIQFFSPRVVPDSMSLSFFSVWDWVWISWVWVECGLTFEAWVCVWLLGVSRVYVSELDEDFECL